MIKVNLSPVLTAQNFGVNFLDLDPQVFEKPEKEFKNFEIKNSQIAEIKKLENFLLSLPISKGMSSLKPNLKFSVDIFKTSEVPIIITFSQKQKEVLCDQIFVRTNENVKAKLILNYFGKNLSKTFSKLYFELEKNSELEIIIFCDNYTNLLNIEKNLQKNAKITCYFVDFAKNLSVSNLFAKVFENGSCDFSSVYLSSKIVDQNYCITLNEKEAKTNIDVLGALYENAQKTFRGTIDFKSGAKKSIGNEKEFCLLLSDEARSKSLPILLSNEENATGSHSSSSGKVDENELFYLMSRGLSRSQAKTILVKSKFQKIVSKIFDEHTQELISKKIEKEFKSEE